MNFAVGSAAIRRAMPQVIERAQELYIPSVPDLRDKTCPGATSAAWASPWGQAISAGDSNNTYFGSYREVFARDLYEAWTSMFLAGDTRTARDMTRFLFEKQQLPDGSMPRNSLTNGKQAPDSFNTQLDEVAYPIVMAYQLGLTGKSLYRNHIRPAAYYVAAHGPAAGPERWEEQSGYSPSTIAAEIAGLTCAAEIARRNNDDASAAVYTAAADDFARNVERWTATTTSSESSTAVSIDVAVSSTAPRWRATWRVSSSASLETPRTS